MRRPPSNVFGEAIYYDFFLFWSVSMFRKHPSRKKSRINSLLSLLYHAPNQKNCVKVFIPKSWIKAYRDHCGNKSYYRDKCDTIPDCAWKIHEQTGIAYDILLKDMRNCLRRYSATGMEYMKYRFYQLNDYGRDSFLTERRTRILDAFLNPHEFGYLYKQKIIFADNFKDFLKRRWLHAPDATESQIESFLKELGTVIVKPSAGRQGKGITKMRFADIPDMQGFCRRVVEEKAILEENVRQHPCLDAISPNSLATLRLVTLLDPHGYPYLLACAFRTATNAESVVDNLSVGGMVAHVDQATGIIASPGIDLKLTTYLTHPLTGQMLLGFHFPFGKKFRKWRCVLHWSFLNFAIPAGISRSRKTALC